MSDSIRQANGSGHSNPIDPAEAGRSSAVDLAEMRAWINRAMAEAGWNQEALATHLNKDKAYVSRVLSGEKPLSAAFIRELPDEIEAIVARFHAESFGLVVVMPVSGADAVRNLVSGLIGVLQASRLPEKAGPMVKAEIGVQGVRRRA